MERRFAQYEVVSIEGESHPFGGGAFWERGRHVSSKWERVKPSWKRVRKMLFFPECFGECPTAPNPLGIELPAVAEVGKPVTATVTAYANPSGTPSPAGDATVVYGGGVAQTDSSGHDGAHLLQRRAHGSESHERRDAVRTETTVCVHDGNDGTCGTQASSGSAGSAAVTTGAAAVVPFKGPYALVPRLDRSGRRPRLHPRARPAHPLGQRARAHDGLLDQPCAASRVPSPLLRLRRRHRPGSSARVAARASRSKCLPTARSPTCCPWRLRPAGTCSTSRPPTPLATARRSRGGRRGSCSMSARPASRMSG